MNTETKEQLTHGIERVVDDQGICTLTLDQKDRSTNVIDDRFIRALGTHLDWLSSEKAEDVRGILLRSNKTTFMVGADLFELESLCRDAPSMAADALQDLLSALTRQLRRLETQGKPVACAIEGQALGGGLELALACHWRVMSGADAVQIGLPEVQVGLLPGGGGTQRLPRMIGLTQALPLLLEGRSLGAQEALRSGLVDEVSAEGDALTKARAWLLSDAASGRARWDSKDFRYPGGGGAMDPRAVQTFIGATAMTRSKTGGNYPAAQAILAAVFEGSVVGFDRALEIETRYFAHLFREGTAARMIRTLFINKGKADKLIRRPSGVPPTSLRAIGVLGAGMMGAGIAYVAARAGLRVVLIDQTMESAAKGKSYSEGLLQKLQSRGKLSPDDADTILERILPSTEYGALNNVQLVVEAVFEDREVKAQVTRLAEASMPRDAIYASNTSTLPITGLAQASARPESFLGLHFFSPVEKMPLVEVIRGERTSPAALAVALDFVKALKKTPIVVNDARGFFTTKVVSAYMLEGQAMLLEGIPAALIENAGRLAGMPVGPLALSDEVSLELSSKIRRQWKIDLGADYPTHPGEPVTDLMVDEHKRLGRKNGKGFYDYPEGAKKRLWPELATLFPARPAGQLPSFSEIKERLLYVQAIETVRCLEAGVLMHADDADIGAVFGFGFAPFWGGPLSMVEAIGPREFVKRCRHLETMHGSRFHPSPSLLSLSESDEGAFVRD